MWSPIDYQRVSLAEIEREGDRTIIRTSVAPVSSVRVTVIAILLLVSVTLLVSGIAALFILTNRVAAAPALVGFVLGAIAVGELSRLGERTTFEVAPDQLIVLQQSLLRKATTEFWRAHILNVQIFQTGTNVFGRRMFDLRVSERLNQCSQFMIGRREDEIRRVASRLGEALSVPVIEKRASVVN